MAQTALDRAGQSKANLSDTVELRGIARSAYIPLLAVVYGIGLALFLAAEPTKPWILLALVALVGLGTDGILRSHPRGQLRGIADTAPFLFVPVLLALANGLFLEEVDLTYRTTAPAVPMQ